MGGHATFFTFTRHFFSFFGSGFLGTKKRDEQTAEMVCETMISNWLAVFGAPDILIVDKDRISIGEIFQDFRASRNITLQAAIPWHHQSLGATGRRRGYFRGIIERIIRNRKSNCLASKEWGEFSAMTAMRLNSQVRQFDGFTPGQRVFGRTPKLPIGAVRNPNFAEFMNPAAAPTAKSLSLASMVFSNSKSVFRSRF